jgi:hypothetical protein
MRQCLGISPSKNAIAVYHEEKSVEDRREIGHSSHRKPPGKDVPAPFALLLNLPASASDDAVTAVNDDRSA